MPIPSKLTLVPDRARQPLSIPLIDVSYHRPSPSQKAKYSKKLLELQKNLYQFAPKPIPSKSTLVPDRGHRVLSETSVSLLGIDRAPLIGPGTSDG